jgi:RNA ligase partner protein
LLVFVLDTSAVADQGLRAHLGASSLRETIVRLTELMRKAAVKLGARFYVTPQMMEELRGFLRNNGVDEETLRRFSAWLIVKSPNLMEIKVPAAVMALYVEEFQRRLMRGLRVAEDVVRKASITSGVEEVGSVIRSLRERYREATRHGVVDSMVDFTSVMLALEVNGMMVSSDEGIRRLCEALGITVLTPTHFADMLEEHLRAFSQSSP